MKRRLALGIGATFVCAAVSGAVGCRRAEDSATRGPDAATVEPPAPAPDGRLADAVLTTPEAFWQRLQRGVGGALGLFPKDFGGLVCAAAGLDPGLASSVDGASPVYAVLGRSGDAGVAWAVAIRLKDGAAGAWVDDETARYGSKEVGGFRVLVGKGGASLPFAAGLTRAGSLVVASTEQDLVRLGPYASRTLPTKAPSADGAPLTIDVPRDALAGAGRAEAGLGWAGLRALLLQNDAQMRASHGGRAPDFGDATAIVAALDGFVERRLAVLGDLERAHVAIDADEDEVHAVLTVDPAPGAGPARAAFDALLPGDAAPLLAAPKDAVVAVLAREGAAAREADARDLAATIGQVLGARLTDDGRRRLHDALEGAAKGGGDWWTASVVGGPTRALLVRTPATDKAVLAKAVRDGVDLLARPGFKEPIGQFFGAGEPSWAALEVPGGGKGTLVTWGRGGARAASGRGVGEAAWLVGDRLDLAFAVGERPGGAAAWLGGGAPARLGDDPQVARPLGAAEANASFVIVAQPLKLDPTRGAGESAPVVLTWGRRAAQGWGRADVSDRLLRELLRVAGRP